MLWIHPLLQLLCLLPAIWVLAMGVQRLRVQHLGAKAPFPWKRHVFWGKVVHLVWLGGLGLGLFQAWYFWGAVGYTGAHFGIGLAMLPLLALGLATGLLLQKPKGRRPGLALVHGVANLLLVLLALAQAVTGIGVIQLFLLP